jgi:hypothetical protein
MRRTSSQSRVAASVALAATLVDGIGFSPVIVFRAVQAPPLQP